MDEESLVCSLDPRTKTNWWRNKQAAKEDTKIPLWSVSGLYYKDLGFRPFCVFLLPTIHDIGDPDNKISYWNIIPNLIFFAPLN